MTEQTNKQAKKKKNPSESPGKNHLHTHTVKVLKEERENGGERGHGYHSQK